jgi:methionyl-tRNA formyltransferase
LSLRAIFFAAPGLFSARALHAWLARGHEVALLVLPARGRAHGSALRWIAPRWSLRAAVDRHAIPTRRVSGGRDLAQEPLPGADLAISVGFPFRIPMAQVRALPRGGVNLHPALLPACRGPRPLTALCLDGEAERHGGVSLHLLEQEFDAGPLLDQERVPWRRPHEAWLLELARAHGRLIGSLERYLAGELVPVAQDESRARTRRPPRVALTPALSAAELERICATLGSRRRLRLEAEGRRIAVRGYLGSAAKSGAPLRTSRLSVEFDARDARVRLARWLPGTRSFRDARWLLRLALASG